MCYIDMIKNIQKLARGENVYDDSLGKMLLENRCYYLLFQSENYAQKYLLTMGMNSLVVRQLYAICHTVFDKLRSIPYVHIKGGALSSRIYGNPACRSFGDIDLLIPPEYSEKVKKLLRESGFVQGRLIDGKISPFSRKEMIYQKSFSHQLAPFIKESGAKMCPYVKIDVNLDIIWGEGDVFVDMNKFVSNFEYLEVTDYKIRCLQPVWEFISLCMHHYKDANSIYLIANRGFDLSEYCDIYFYLINVSPNANKIAEVSKEYGLSDYVFYCIYCTNVIFNDCRLSVYLDKLDSESARKLLCCYGLTDSERKEWDVSFSERLFDRNFRANFYASLSAKERRKVEINRMFM